MDLFALELIVLLRQKISAACIERCLGRDTLFGCVFISFSSIFTFLVSKFCVVTC